MTARRSLRILLAFVALDVCVALAAWGVYVVLRG